jgi:exonuclease VII small subunit
LVWEWAASLANDEPDFVGELEEVVASLQNAESKLNGMSDENQPARLVVREVSTALSSVESLLEDFEDQKADAEAWLSEYDGEDDPEFSADQVEYNIGLLDLSVEQRMSVLSRDACNDIVRTIKSDGWSTSCSVMTGDPKKSHKFGTCFYKGNYGEAGYQEFWFNICSFDSLKKLLEV